MLNLQTSVYSLVTATNNYLHAGQLWWERLS